MFGKKKPSQTQWRQEGKVPVIRASICTGEQVAGFRDSGSEKFQDIMLIKTERDLKQFKEIYGIREEELRREW